ncbi:hypothetical protein Tco_1253963 [Tanacetum coccineum]
MTSYSFPHGLTIIPAAQLVPKFQGIGRCNNYDVLQSIPCSLECKIVGHILLDHPLSYALTATTDVPAVYLQQFWKIVCKLPVETPENSFFVPVNIEIIESFMYTISYQIVVDKVSAFYKKFLAQPGQTMFKVFDRFLTTRTSRHDQTKINILQLFHAVVNRINVDYDALLWWNFINCVSQMKDVIQYPRFTKLIIADLMKKFPSIPLRLGKDYHSIKDDIPLSSGKKRKQSAGETSSPQKLLKVTIKQKQVVEGEKDVESYADKFAASMIHDDEEKKDEKEGDEMGSLETRTEKMKTLIPTTLGSPRINLSLDKNIAQEFTDTVSLSTATTSKYPHKKRRISSKYNHLPGALRRMCTLPALISKEFDAQAPQILEELFKNYIQTNVIQVHPTTTTSTKTTSSTDLQQQLYLKMKSNLQYQANDPALWDGEKRVKRHKTSKSSKSARGSSSKRSAKDSTTYVSKQQQQEMDAWEDKTIIDKDEVIPVDETPELIKKIQNVDKRVPTIFDRARMETTLNDMLSN